MTVFQCAASDCRQVTFVTRSKPAASRACFPRDFPRRSHSPRSFPRNIPRRSRGPALACPPLSASVIGGRTTSLSKQSLRTCNVDNELRQALVLLRCPPILADWRTTINAELAHYPRGRPEASNLTV